MGLETGVIVAIVASTVISATTAMISASATAAAQKKSAAAQAAAQKAASDAQAQQLEASASRALAEKQYMEGRRSLEMRDERRARAIRRSQNVNNVTGLELSAGVEQLLAIDEKADRMALNSLSWDWGAKIDSKLDEANMLLWDAETTRQAGAFGASTTRYVGAQNASSTMTSGYMQGLSAVGQGAMSYGTIRGFKE